MKPIHLNAKLDPVKDADIIDFLQDKNKTHIIREAIRFYMKRYQEAFDDDHVPHANKGGSDEGSALLEGF